MELEGSLDSPKRRREEIFDGQPHLTFSSISIKSDVVGIGNRAQRMLGRMLNWNYPG